MPRCKNCKEKFAAINFNQKYCFTPACVGVWVLSIQAEKEKAVLKKWKAEKTLYYKTRITTLRKDAQFFFNKFIRLRDKNNSCISCNIKLPEKYDAGHFWNKQNHSNVTYNELNVHAQCVTCNQHKHGNLINYRDNLIEKIGIDKYNELQDLSKITKKWSKEELQAIIDIYKKKANALHQP